MVDYAAARFDFCIGCHLAVENQDHLYFVPKSIRAMPAE